MHFAVTRNIVSHSASSMPSPRCELIRARSRMIRNLSQACVSGGLADLGFRSSRKPCEDRAVFGESTKEAGFCWHATTLRSHFGFARPECRNSLANVNGSLTARRFATFAQTLKKAKTMRWHSSRRSSRWKGRMIHHQVEQRVKFRCWKVQGARRRWDD